MNDNSSDGGRNATVAVPDSGRALILNPVSGSGDHVDAVRRAAEDRGIAVLETREAGDAFSLAKAAIEDISLLLMGERRW